MKIEKINDTQIKCTLTKEDLESRHLKLSELAYGNEKAKELFRDLMEQAAYEFGFETEDIPLMIEAVPLPSESIVLIVTKVEYPEELDTRFSQFSDYQGSDDSSYHDFSPKSGNPANDILELFKQAQTASGSDGIKAGDVDLEEAGKKIDISKLFVFDNLDNIIRLAHILDGFYHGSNVLYKSPHDKLFYLIISKSDHTPEEFNKVCNIITEYGSQADFSVGQNSFFNEHYKLIIAHDALESLAKL